MFVNAVTPLGTGKGLLEISFIRVLRPIAASRETVRLEVTERGRGHLIGRRQDVPESEALVVITEATFDWLQSLCPQLWSRLPDRPARFIILGEPPPEPKISDYRAEAFGTTEQDLLEGAHESSFGCEQPPMAERPMKFRLDVMLEPFDAWLAWRGVVPQEMEEKWFIYRRGSTLLFRRSWTGLLVYEVETEWRGDRLHLGEVRATRDRRQEQVTGDEARDRQVLRWIIDAVLLRRPRPFPAKPGSDWESAWNAGGSALLR